MARRLNTQRLLGPSVRDNWFQVMPQLLTLNVLSYEMAVFLFVSGWEHRERLTWVLLQSQGHDDFPDDSYPYFR